MSEGHQMRYVKKAQAVRAIRDLPAILAEDLGKANARFRNQESSLQATRAKESIGWLAVFKKMNRGK